MNFQILPNKFKSIGLIIFIIGFGIPVIIGFYEGISQPFNSNETLLLTSELLDSILLKWLNIFTILGMLTYMLSKEKIEDDYITKIRLEAYQITTILCLTSTIVLHIINNEMKFYVSYVIYVFIILYLITFYLKKRFVL